METTDLRKTMINPKQMTPPLRHIELLPPYVQSIVRYYATQPNIELVMTIGSISSNTSDKNSDIDLVIVYDDGGIPSEEQRIKTIKDLSNNMAVFNTTNAQIWLYGTSDDFIIDDQEICTQFFTKSYIQQKTELIIDGIYEQIGMQHPLASLSSILTASVHIDTNKLYDELLSKLKPYPKALQETIINEQLGMRLPYYIDRLQTAIDRNDIPFAYKMICQAIDSIIYIIFAQQEHLPNGPKRLFQQIDEMVDKNTALYFKKNLLNLYTVELDPQTLKGKISILQSMFRFLQKTSSSLEYKI